jgi:hypothetical protein
MATRAVVTKRRLRRPVAAFGLACTADWVFGVALAVVAYRDAGAEGVGLVALARLLPSALLTPLATAVADRARREVVLIVVSVVRLATIGASAVLLAVGSPLGAVYALAVVATIAFTVFRPAHSALLPSLCATTAELTSSNVVRGLLEALATLVGPLIAGVLLVSAGPALAFAAAAALSAGPAWMLRGIHPDVVARASQPAGATVLRDAIAGVRAVARDLDLLLVFGAGFFQTYVRGALNVFSVVLAFDVLGTGDPGVAALAAAMGVGGIAGSVCGSFLVGSRRLGRWLAVALVLWGLPIALLAGVSSAEATLALVAIVGLANGVIDIPLFTLPVRLASDEVLARVFGVFESMVAAGVALGSALTPALIALVDLPAALVVTGLVLPVVAAAGWSRLSTLDRQLAVRDAEIAVLRRTALLGLLPVPSIEHLAARLHRRTIAAGTVLFDQDTPGDSYYVVVDGQADVIGNGELIASLGPGDGFGEIALLHDIPRTAAVRANGDLVVFEIDGATFLETVASHSQSTEAADALVARRLAHYRPSTLTI